MFGKWCCDLSDKKGHMSHKGGGAFYGLGFIGALIYNMQYAASFGQVLFGIFKSIFWPAYLIYELFSYFQI